MLMSKLSPGIDPFVDFKAIQKESWSLFAPLEAVTTVPAASLVRFSKLKSTEKVLDVGCGTGVVAVTAAQLGAKVFGLDLSPKLLERARENAALAQVKIDFVEGDAEALPYSDASFDVVLSQFGHMFAPRPSVAIQEMLRVLKPGGTIAFSTWPPHLYVGRMFALVASFMPPPEGVASPVQWGDSNTVRERLGSAVSELVFETDMMTYPALSKGHYLRSIETTVGPVIKLVEKSKEKPEILERFRNELQALVSEYTVGNAVRQQYLMSRAIKR